MIQNILLPTKIGNYYLFPTRIVSLVFNKTHISATQTYLHGTKIVVEKNLEEQISNDASLDYQERTTQTLKKILDAVDKYDAIYTSLPSSAVIFKELKLPFIKRSQLQLVVEFEVAPLLPFSVDEAVVDFIITKQLPEEKSSEIIVAAVQKQYIIQHLTLLEAAGISPELITVDAFALYGLYTRIDEYKKLDGSVTLIEISSHATQIIYIYNNQLKLVRSLPLGTIDLAKTMSEQLQITIGESMENLVRFGVTNEGNTEYTKAAQTIFTNYWNKIAFTLNSFSAQSDLTNKQMTIILLGDGAAIKGMSPFVTTQLTIKCVPFDLKLLGNDPLITFAQKNEISLSNSVSLAVSLPSLTTESFNLYKKEFSQETDAALLNKQLITAGILALLIIGSLLFFMYKQLSSMRYAVQEAKDEVTTLLKKEFPTIDEQQELEDIVYETRRLVQEEENLWFSFANPARTSFLKYLLELTNKIDKEALGFDIDALKITQDEIVLSARVKDYEALILLEKELRQSKLFTHLEEQDNPVFTMKIRLAKT